VNKKSGETETSTRLLRPHQYGPGLHQADREFDERCYLRRNRQVEPP
jgi:hypothetical protein